MNLLLSRVAQKLLAVGLLLVLIAAGWFLIFENIAAKFAYYEKSIERQLELLARFQAVAAKEDELELRIEKLREVEKSRGGFLEGPTANVAAAELQKWLKDLVTRNSALLKSSQIYAAETAKSGFEKVSLGLTVVGDFDSLFQTLHSIETGTHFLVVEEFNARKQVVRRRVRSRAERGVVDTRGEAETLIQARIRIAGYLRVPVGSIQ